MAMRREPVQNEVMQTISADLPPFGDVLRECRRARSLSQLELSLEANVSQRHLSFLESGKAKPSRDMILQLAQVLDLPLRGRNRLLLSAGFAGHYPVRALEAEDMRPVRQALELILKHHEPYPAVVVDRQWNLLMVNDPITRLLSLLGDSEAMWKRVCGEGPRNLLKLTFHAQGLRPYIRNFDEFAPVLLARTAREALEHPQVDEVMREVLSYPDLPTRLRSADLQAHGLPVVPTHLESNGMSLRLFTMLTTFGTPQDVTTDELRVEQSFPADTQSADLLRQLAGS
jgi:transcriptional regulator with XRE-family HTH domain